ncbi:arginine decarboxylase, pyruvoyl-dependent [candidate division WOR-3 bacterium RBG_13_43_14]|uniref:Pyruvoyl-dependent arginine decarboxylase AaxB n=1 Tax=candidate division WOR-3 bacterium RBG_13_43_14 TaxID=1802590 RepID=A0A1F4U962_UNCW3|nr:MAG: arginine decarboxylase, pyruvoyl-dependent [candidate division WOR-3 bacterium RBG_13_43_14]
MFIPKKLFLTKGVGKHKEKLASFEAALRDAGIAPFNIVRVSSILPPGAKILSKTKGLQYLSPGEIIYAVLAECSTNEPHRLISAAVGVAIPSDRNQYGYLSEYHSNGETEIKTRDKAEDLAAQMLATTLGVPFDPDTSYDERKELWKISTKIVRTSNICQTAIGDKYGLWTTVLATAVLIP